MQRLASVTAALCLLGLACALPMGCSAAGATGRATAAPFVSADDYSDVLTLADELDLNCHARTDAPVVELSGQGDERILLFPGTNTVSIAGTAFETQAAVLESGGRTFVTEADAASIRALWWGAVGRSSGSAHRVTLPAPPDPLPTSASAAPRRVDAPREQAPAHTALAPPTAAERRAWGVKLRRTWSYLVVHHSGGASGSAAVFHQAHKDRGWDGLGYHFVIGNGKGSPDGRIEVGYRWTQQRVGAHAGQRTMNEHGIGICLVGNFETGRPTRRQIESLTRLCRFLAAHCDIGPAGVRRHGEFRETACPGRNFPRDWTYLDDPSGVATR